MSRGFSLARRNLILAALAAVALGPTTTWSRSLKAAPPVDALRFWLNDAYPGATVTGDGLGEYVDYRLTLEETCVDAQVTGGAFAFVRLNREVAPDERCSPDFGGPQRQWILQVEGDDICARIAAYDPAAVVTFVGGCSVTGSDSPRIRVPNLYPKRVPAATAIDFLMKSLTPPDGHGGYEFRSDGLAVVTGTSSTRTVTYEGTATVYEFTGAGAIGTFPMKMQITFTRIRL